MPHQMIVALAAVQHRWRVNQLRIPAIDQFVVTLATKRVVSR